MYADDYADPLERYKEITAQTTKSNPETMGRYHMNWLNMMYPRLRLAANLLRDDGVRFISVDDNELDNLKKLCNEAFGEKNFRNILAVRRYDKNLNRQFMDSGLMTLNVGSEDGGNRQFIMVQLPEVCDEKSEAYKAGFRNICEIGKERVRRAGAKILNEAKRRNSQLKIGGGRRKRCCLTWVSACSNWTRPT